MSITKSPSRNETAHTAPEFSEKVKELRTLLSDIAQSAPAAASESFKDLKTRAAALCDNCDNKIDDISHKAMKIVKDRPVQVALVAVSAGLLTWWLMKHNSKNCD